MPNDAFSERPHLLEPREHRQDNYFGELVDLLSPGELDTAVALGGNAEKGKRMLDSEFCEDLKQ